MKRMKRTLITAMSVGALATAILASGSMFSSLNAQTARAQDAAAPAVAVQTTTFDVEKMTCALCPVTVKTAMGRVEGVQSVEVDFASKTAKAVFDPSVTSVAAIAAASTNAGYPAHAKD
jgi:mercuric ion binding protein